jgi:hypothetical protein
MGSRHDLFEDIPHKMSVMQGSISNHLFNEPVEILCHNPSEVLSEHTLASRL